MEKLILNIFVDFHFISARSGKHFWESSLKNSHINNNTPAVPSY